MKRKFNRNVSIMLASTVMLTTAFSNVSFANVKETSNIVLNENISLLSDVSTSEGAIHLIDVPEGNKPSQAVQTPANISSIPSDSMALKMNVTKPKLQYKKGDKILVDVSIENNKGFSGVYFGLNYDEEYLKPVALEKEDMYTPEDGFISIEGDDAKKVAVPGAAVNNSVKVAKDGKLKFGTQFQDAGGAPLMTTENGKLLRVKFELLKEGNAVVTTSPEKGAFLTDNDGANAVPMYSQDGVMKIGDTTIGIKEPINFTVGQNNKITAKASSVDGIPTITVAGPVFAGYTNGEITNSLATINILQKSMGDTTIEALINELVANIGGNAISATSVTSVNGMKGIAVYYGGEGQGQVYNILFNVVPIAFENADFTVGSSETVKVVADNPEGTKATVTAAGSILSKATITASATDASATVTVPKSALGSKKLFSVISSMIDTIAGNAKTAELNGETGIKVTYGENQTYLINFVEKDDSTPTDPDDGDDNNNSGGGGGGGGSSSKASKETTKPDVKDPIKPSNPVQPSKKVSFVTKSGVTITPPTTSLGTKTFTDISSRPWAEASINKLASYGIINGVGDGKFAPDANSKRADFMVMMSKVLGLTGSSSSNFDDVSADKYYAQAVGQLKDIGIASGVGNNKFNPESTITRQDMMAIVARALDMIDALPEADTSVLDKFADKDKIASYAQDSLASLVELGIVTGTGANLEPTALITRAQMSVIMSKVYDIVVDKAYEAQENATEATTSEEDSTETTTEEDTTETTTEEDSTETTTEEE